MKLDVIEVVTEVANAVGSGSDSLTGGVQEMWQPGTRSGSGRG